MKRWSPHDLCILALADFTGWWAGYTLNSRPYKNGILPAEANRRMYEVFGSDVETIKKQTRTRLINKAEYTIETDMIDGERKYRAYKTKEAPIDERMEIHRRMQEMLKAYD